MAAEYSTSGESFVAEAARPFAPGEQSIPLGASATYVVFGDGSRDAALAPPPETAAESRRTSHTVFLNFLDEIERQAARVAGR